MVKRRYSLGNWSFEAWLLPVLFVAAASELARFVYEIPPWRTIGFVDLPWATPFSVVALVVLTHHARGVSYRTNRAYRIALYSQLILAAMVVSSFAILNGLSVTIALVADIANQEILYRFAIPFLIATVLMRFGAHWRDALLVGLAVSTIAFVIAPGDFSELRAGGVFIAMSVLLAHAVWRGRSLVAPIAMHCLYSFLTVNIHHVDLPTPARLSFIAAGLFMLATLGLEPKPELVIDLREPASSKAPELDISPALATGSEIPV